MNSLALLSDAASRPLAATDQVLADLSTEALHAMPGGRNNSIAWLLWHAARQADVQLAALTGQPQVWETGGWGEKLGISRDADSFGFGDSAADVAMLKVNDPQALRDYLAATVEALTAYVATLSDDALDEVVDESYDPPVTRGVRLVSIIDDAAVHAGQAAYVRGLIEDWSIGY